MESNTSRVKNVLHYSKKKIVVKENNLSFRKCFMSNLYFNIITDSVIQFIIRFRQ